MAFATIGTTGIADDAVTSAKVAPGVVDTEAQPNQSPIIINGDMAVAQRSTSATGKSSSGYYTCDRIKLNPDNLGTWTVTQESLTSGNAYANGFRKAFRIDCTTADASPSASDNLSVFQRLEGQDLQLFKKGTANAEKFTLAFWVKSNKTGTTQVNLRDNDNTRMVSATYSISSANTWEHKVLNFPADTTGAFDNDNANSLQIEWFLDSGTDYSSGTAPTAWEASSNADRNANNLDVGGSTDNDWAITGVQLEVGEFTSSTIPPFKHETFGDNLERCRRYYNIFGTNDTGTFAITGRIISSNRFDSQTIPFNPPMRAAPTLSLGGVTDVNAFHFQYDGNGINSGSGSSFSAINAMTVGTRFRISASNTLTADEVANVQSAGSGDGIQHIVFDAEL